MKRVLIVDDSLELGRVLQAILAMIDPNLSITVVPSAEEALLASGRFSLDLLVADIRLPGMSGFDLIQKIRLRNPEVKVILITGMMDEIYQRKAQDLKVDGFFFKPLALPEFQAVVLQCLGLPPAGKPPEIPSPPRITPDVPVSEVAEEGRKRLPDILANLRHSLGAITVILLDERGKTIAQAGELPEATFSQWIPTLMVANSTNNKVGNLVGGEMAENAQAFRGKTFDLVLVGMGDIMLVTILHTGKSALRLALAFEEVLQVQKDIAAVIAAPSVKVQAEVQPGVGIEQQAAVQTIPEAASIIEPESEESADELAVLLEKSERTLSPQDANEFWDSLTVPKPVTTENPDELSYDQAHMLGLAPPEPPDKK